MGVGAFVGFGLLKLKHRGEWYIGDGVCCLVCNIICLSYCFSFVRVSFFSCFNLFHNSV